jgi:hypothetical protein
MRSIAAMFVCAALAMGCGSGPGDPGTGDPELFVGTWQQSGAVSEICSDGSGGTFALMGSITFTTGVTSDLLLNTSACGAIRFDLVSSTMASIQRGQSCSGPTSDGTATVTVHYTTYTFTTTDGRTGTWNITGTLDVVATGGGASGTCNVSGSATMSKV